MAFRARNNHNSSIAARLFTQFTLEATVQWIHLPMLQCTNCSCKECQRSRGRFSQRKTIAVFARKDRIIGGKKVVNAVFAVIPEGMAFLYEY